MGILDIIFGRDEEPSLFIKNKMEHLEDQVEYFKKRAEGALIALAGQMEGNRSANRGLSRLVRKYKSSRPKAEAYLAIKELALHHEENGWHSIPVSTILELVEATEPDYRERYEAKLAAMAEAQESTESIIEKDEGIGGGSSSAPDTTNWNETAKKCAVGAEDS